MVGKLLKHEFRATARVMLPIYAALAASAVLANCSFRFIEVDSVFLKIVFGLFIALFLIGVVASVVLTAVVMIGRFYRNLLKEQGYLAHTLPVSAHCHIWSKLIVSLVWFTATFLLVLLLVLATVLIQAGTPLGEMMADFPSWHAVRTVLIEYGVDPSSLVLLALEGLFGAILACLVQCLHFYAAMSLGHTFPQKRILLSIAFYIGINFAFNILGTSLGVALIQNPAIMYADSMAALISYMPRTVGHVILMELVQGTILYVATYLPLKMGLNLP